MSLKLQHAWRQKGYFDGRAGRPPATTIPAEWKSQYLSGYRTGAREKEAAT